MRLEFSTPGPGNYERNYVDTTLFPTKNHLADTPVFPTKPKDRDTDIAYHGHGAP